MNAHSICSFCLTFLIAFQVLSLGAAEIPAKPETVETNAAEVALAQLREQHQSTLRTLEQWREQADLAARRNNEALTARLNTIEQSLTAQRGQELQAMREANRFTLIVVGSFAAVGVLGMVVSGWFLFRAFTRLGEVARGLRAPLASTVTTGEPLALESSVMPAQRFLLTLERLEKRMLELENVAQSPLPEPADITVSTPPQVSIVETVSAPLDAEASSAKKERVSLLLGKCQTQLNANQTSEALQSLEEVLSLDPQNTEALVKKGKALEKLRRFEEALQAYEKALAVDKNLTIAYLGKGSVFNRMERFGEALQCYEQALRSQQQPRAA